MRLFIALPLPEDIEKMLGEILSDLKQRGRGVRWVASGNIHLTAKFLGETDEVKLESLKDAVARIAGKYSKVRCEINRLGAFPNLRRPRVIWAGLTGDIETLADIASHMDNETHALGFEKESRKFKSHLTLGRVRDSSGLGELLDYIGDYQLSSRPVIFDKIVLFKSTLTPSGPIYDRLFEAELSN